MPSKTMLSGLLMAGALLLVAVLVWVSAGSSQAGPPAADGITMPYAGRLSDAQDLPVADGRYDFHFALHTDTDGDAEIWHETQTDVALAGGSFEVLLGSTAAIPRNWGTGEAAWLSVAVRGPGEAEFTTLAPRQRLNASGAASAGLSAMAGQACPHTHWGEDWSGSGPGLEVHSSSSYALYGSSGTAGWAWLGGVGPIVKGVANCTDCAGVEGRSLYGHGVYGRTSGEWGYRSGVYGEASKTSANGVTGWNTAAGPGVYGYSQDGTAVIAKSASGNLIEAWDTNPSDRRFAVSNLGDVHADGIYYSNGADFAELLPGAAGLEPGDVLVIGAEGRLDRSTQAFQTSVVGVYSSDPGLVGGYREGDDQTGFVPLAVVGIVPVKVSTENGAISPGDLLVSASLAGHAMLAGSNPPQGTIIGKALAGLTAGQDRGVVRALVTLR